MSDLSVQLKPASEATMKLMEQLGITVKPTSQAHASKLIYTEQARLATRFPTDKQVAKVAACGNGTSFIGRDLPGVRFREISFQIELLEILEAIDKAATQTEINSAAVAMIEKVRQRLTKVRRDTQFRDTVVTPEQAGEEPATF